MLKTPLSTILVVDDNLGARRSIEALLAQETYRFLLAESGQAALDILKTNTPDVILLDVMMPGMSGFEVCERIRQNPRISEIPIIMITALDDDESMIQGIDAGADDFLSKPISKIELRSRIRSIIRLNRFRKLCDERQKFEIVVSQSQLGYLVLDDSNRIKFANESAKKMLGFEEQGDEESSFFEIASRRFMSQPENIEQRVEEVERPTQLDPFLLVRSNRQDESAQWIRAQFQELGLEESSQRFLRLEDITDRIVSFQEKQTFARMISHKLLTPLNAIKAAHQMIVGTKSSPERLSQIAEIQQKGIDRLEYDVQSILSFLERDDNPSQSMSLFEIEASIRQHSDAANFSFAVRREDAFPPGSVIAISQHSFEACLREVIENAVKFHKDDATSINCIIRRHQDHANLIFQNNSQPLSEEELENAWKPYWQADRYSTGEVPGMGLGLSLVATNVWTAGGSCKIENCPDGLGVQVTLSFPFSVQT